MGTFEDAEKRHNETVDLAEDARQAVGAAVEHVQAAEDCNNATQDYIAKIQYLIDNFDNSDPEGDKIAIEAAENATRLAQES